MKTINISKTKEQREGLSKVVYTGVFKGKLEKGILKNIIITGKNYDVFTPFTIITQNKTLSVYPVLSPMATDTNKTTITPLIDISIDAEIDKFFYFKIL